jgi:hypothetical protein
LKVAPLTLTDIAINNGITRPSEVPLWKGLSTITVDGKRLHMSVTIDRKTYWIRFGIPNGMLPDSLHQQMKDRGFFFSKNKRLAYFADSTPALVKHIRSFGFDKAQHIPPPAPVEAPVNVKAGSMVIERDPRTNGGAGAKVNTKTTTVAKPKFVKNKAGMWMYSDTGKLAAKADVVEWLYEKSDVRPNDGMIQSLLDTGTRKGETGFIEVGTQVDDETDEELPSFEDMDVDEEIEDTIENSVAYKEGYEDGTFNAADSSFPGIYSLNDMAKYMGVTVAKLEAGMDGGYLLGYLDGFNSVRPKPVLKGLQARLNTFR